MDVRQIRIGGHWVGLVGLDRAFAEVKAMGIAGDGEIAQVLLDKIRADNYVAPSAEGAYRSALLEAYKIYMGEPSSRAPRAPRRPEGRPYPAGCPQCKGENRQR